MCIVGSLLSIELSGPSGSLFENDWMCVWWWWRVNVWYVMFDWVWIMDDFVVHDLWLGKLEDHHGCGHDEREKSECHCFPCFHCNQGKCQRNKNGCLNLQTQQEWNHNFFDESTSCER